MSGFPLDIRGIFPSLDNPGRPIRTDPRHSSKDIGFGYVADMARVDFERIYQPGFVVEVGAAIKITEIVPDFKLSLRSAKVGL